MFQSNLALVRSLKHSDGEAENSLSSPSSHASLVRLPAIETLASTSCSSGNNIQDQDAHLSKEIEDPFQVTIVSDKVGEFLRPLIHWCCADSSGTTSTAPTGCNEVILF